MVGPLYTSRGGECDIRWPRIYQEATGEAFPVRPADDNLLGPDDASKEPTKWRL